MKVIDFNKNTITPEDVLKNALDSLDDIKDIIIIAETKDNTILHSNSLMKCSQFVGMMEITKVEAINEME